MIATEVSSRRSQAEEGGFITTPKGINKTGYFQRPSSFLFLNLSAPLDIAEHFLLLLFLI